MLTYAVEYSVATSKASTEKAGSTLSTCSSFMVISALSSGNKAMFASTFKAFEFSLYQRAMVHSCDMQPKF